MGNEKIYSGPEAAKILGRSQELVRKLCQAGKIKATKINQYWAIKEGDLQCYLKNKSKK